MSAAATPGAMPDLSALVGSLLSNPAAMSMLSSLLASKGGGTGTGNYPPSQEAQTPSEAAPSSPPPPPLAPAQPVFAPAQGEDHRAALLCALRPFLPPEKCDMIDGLLRILDLLAIIRRRR